MARQRKPYNINTAYGRRKLREEAAYKYETGTPEYRQEIDNIGCWVWGIIIVIIIIIGIIAFATGNGERFTKWLSH